MPGEARIAKRSVFTRLSKAIYLWLHSAITETLPDWIKFKLWDTVLAIIVYFIGRRSERLRDFMENVLAWP